MTGLGAALVAAGWQSLGSGLYRSAVTAAPKSNSIRVQLTDPGSGNCATVQIQNDTGDRVSTQVYLLPAAGKVYRVIACRYNFFCMTAGVSNAREFACGGTLHIPDHLNGITTGSLGWLQGNATSDGDGSNNRPCFRTRLAIYDFDPVRNSFLRNGSILNVSGNNYPASMHLVVSTGAATQQIAGSASYRWVDDSIAIVEAIFCSGIASTADEAKRQGLIHNCLVSADSYPADTVLSAPYDGHTWMAITGNNTGNGNFTRGTLFVALT